MYSLEEIGNFRKTFGGKDVLLDTNLLLLLLIGSYNTSFLKKCKATKNFTEEDYKLLLKILENFNQKIIITPHILAEFSNLSKQGISNEEICSYIKYFLEKLDSFTEHHIPMKHIFSKGYVIISRFGVSDIGIIETAKELSVVILTNDSKLNLHAEENRIPSCSFQAIKGNLLLK